jgi:predicted nuclease of predicted toxin-antitoxin system
MIFWLDAQLPPALAPWLTTTFGIPAHPVRDLGLREAKDPEIFQAARDAKAVVLTKDSDFVEFVARLGPPPQIIWITCGNTTNARLREILGKSLPTAMPLIEAGEPLVEITDSA